MPLLTMRYWLAVALTAVATGLIGAFFTWVLDFTETVAFGFTTGSFAEAITQVSPSRRFFSVFGAGFIIAVIWYCLRRWGPAICSPTQLAAGKTTAPVWMAADTTLQVVNVAVGGSIGREGAPRQVAALSGQRFGRWLGFDESTVQLLTAAGAGAGLAAIYNAPITGGFFALETILRWQFFRKGKSRIIASVLSCFAIAWGAVMVARIAVPNRPAYEMKWQDTSREWLWVALLLSPFVGVLGSLFGRAIEWIGARMPKGRHILWRMPLCYVVLAGLCWYLPLVLGNGHALMQNLVEGALSPAVVCLMIFAKPLATILTVCAGASGGKLTPALSTGTALGMSFALLLSFIAPAQGIAMGVVLGGCFLAGSMRAPVTATVIAIEFTAAPLAIWIPGLITAFCAWRAGSYASALLPKSPTSTDPAH